MTQTAAPLLLPSPTPLDELLAQFDALRTRRERAAQRIGDNYVFWIECLAARSPSTWTWKQLCEAVDEYYEVEREMARMEYRIDLWTDLERGANNP